MGCVGLSAQVAAVVAHVPSQKGFYCRVYLQVGNCQEPHSGLGGKKLDPEVQSM